MDQFYRKEGKPMISEKMIPLMKNNSAIRMMFGGEIWT
jgi:ribosome biogenesis SPOUT family RNA methylase Rps3